MKTSKDDAFTKDAICAIIKECGQNGVREFNFRGLKISYGPLAQVSSPDTVYVPTKTQDTANSQAREAIEKKEQEIKEDLINALIIEDPEGYEQLLKDEELVDEPEADEE